MDGGREEEKKRKEKEEKGESQQVKRERRTESEGEGAYEKKNRRWKRRMSGYSWWRATDCLLLVRSNIYVSLSTLSQMYKHARTHIHTHTHMCNATRLHRHSAHILALRRAWR